MDYKWPQEKSWRGARRAGSRVEREGFAAGPLGIAFAVSGRMSAVSTIVGTRSGGRAACACGTTAALTNVFSNPAGPPCAAGPLKLPVPYVITERTAAKMSIGGRVRVIICSPIKVTFMETLDVALNFAKTQTAHASGGEKSK